MLERDDMLQEWRITLITVADGPASPRAAVHSPVTASRFDREKAQALVEFRTAVVRNKIKEVTSAGLTGTTA